MRLSIIIPVYNEVQTIRRVLERVAQVPFEIEIIVVDDGSTDGTRELLQELLRLNNPTSFKLVLQKQNQGKGAAIQAGLKEVTGEIVVVQDADLEYHPEDYPLAVRLIAEGYADAVYGSRFLGAHRCFYFWHYAGNKLITFVCNLLYDTILTDVETGFKVVRADVLKKLGIRSKTFDFEVELTAKLLKNRCRVYEMPILYTGRDYAEGKKVTWVDGLRALWGLVKFRLMG